MAEDRFAVFPTRMNYRLLEQRILSAKKGHSLLKTKSDVLQMKFRHLETDFIKSEQEIEILFKKAFLMLSKAEYYGGDLQHFLKLCEKSLFKIETTMEQVCGVQLPIFKINKESYNDDFFLMVSGDKFMNAKRMFEDLVNLIVELCSLKNSYSILKSTLESTNRRMKALEFIVIPKLESTVHFISIELDEQERDDFYRLKKIQNINKIDSQKDID